MNEYEIHVYDEVIEWKRKMRKRSNMLTRASKKMQTRINGFIPEKAHQIMTEAIRNMVKATLTGSEYTTKRGQGAGLSLKERDDRLKEKLNSYRKTAMIEGAGTGAGGLFLGLADFPLLLSIKMKFLFEAASIYGYDSKYEERLFILYVFQLAFSSDDKRRETLDVIEEWETRKQELLEMDWRDFQQEYRDYIDLVKMAQLVPGIGAVVGAYANYNLLDHLGETAMNAYRLRILKTPPEV